MLNHTMAGGHREPVQLEIAFRKPGRGGKRPGAGRKPSKERIGFVPHVVRPRHDENHPVHVTMRAVTRCPNLRSQMVFRAIRSWIAKASARPLSFRVIHFSVQANHVHLIVEAPSRVWLWRGMQWLSARIAKHVNALAGRRGSLWRDRYHRHDLRTPREVRNAIVYVVMNVRKHARGADVERRKVSLDICSSAAWLDWWHPRAGPMLGALRDDLVRHDLAECPVVASAVWLGRIGWKRLGLVRPSETPRAPA